MLLLSDICTQQQHSYIMCYIIQKNTLDKLWIALAACFFTWHMDKMYSKEYFTATTIKSVWPLILSAVEDGKLH